MRRVHMRRGFTLIELLVVIAIIAVLIALLVPAVQKVREASARTTCVNNLKQLALGVHSFHTANKCFPTYNGIFPVSSTGSTLQTANTHSVYGSWIVHLLPYIEQDSLYDTIKADVQQYTNTGGLVAAPGGTLISPAVAAYWSPAPKLVTPAVPATYNNYTGSEQYVATTAANGYTIYTLQWVPARTPDAGTGTAAVYDYTGCTYVPAVAAVYGPPGAPVNGYVGIWNPAHRAIPIPVLRCPTDPSYFQAAASAGIVYANTANPLAGTNYLANWNILCTKQPTLGYTASPQTFASVTDGLSNTILLAEAYAYCEAKGRTAMLAWHTGQGGLPNYGGVHNFGLTYSLGNDQLSVAGAAPVTVQSTNGFPNPSLNPAVSFYFQIRPDPIKTGAGGCDSMTVQSGHQVLNIALGDGSVRSVSAGLDPNTWISLMLPTDGGPVVLD